MPLLLVADDHPLFRDALRRLVGGFWPDVTVQEANDAESALFARLILQDADLLLLDLNMPGMNGIELIKEVRKLPNYRFMPILFLTTESQQSRKMEAKAAGASGWIVKPATADELLNTIKLVLR